MESRQWLEQELEQIRRWEKDQGKVRIWDRIGRIPFALLDKVTPEFIQNKVGKALDELGKFVQTGGGYLSSEKAVANYFHNQQVRTIADARRMPVSAMDEAADRVSGTRTNVATVQGASTGFGGIFTLSLDIPVLLGLQLKTLQDIAMCYGFDPADPKERLFIVKVMQYVTSDNHGRDSIIKQMDHLDGGSEEARREVVSELKGWREVVLSFRDRWGMKKMFQLIPVAGLVFGAITNRNTISELAEAGTILYRKRRIRERLATLDLQTEASINQ
ncbi:EcsC protein family protein [Bhargavaea cecembensis DSE10]|uniref:EcsC protein family protein n=1 Tax=Bhargavaea cecembensis DSE10 TaxID=1235279 RepID=M7NYS9_9BACL|nr:EcsC family protein [Bhargavaea cecembensis]EMR06805.1 EcsC protein family protein [Bhargavaea cecembensis DSE10]